MLKKLIKNEFKNSLLELGIVNGAVLVITVLVALLINIGTSMIYKSMGLASLFLLYAGQIIIVFITIIKSLNNKLFTNEGYLSFTLPVTTHELLLSKIIVNVIWIIITAITLIMSFFIMGVIVVSDLGIEIGLYFEMTEFVAANLPSALILLLGLIVSATLFVCTIIGVLVILNTGKMKKKKLLIGIILYYVVTNAIAWIEQFIIIIPYSLYYTGESLTFGPSVTFYSLFMETPSILGYPLLSFNTLLIELLIIGGIYFFSVKMLQKHLELE
ncbi:MAG: hypothetical protein PHY42_06695 [Bacilli bacterium]|nr:hypothetical protein [Bacilli bacterium]